MTDEPDEQRRFWSTSLPWKCVFVLVYCAGSASLPVMFWNAQPFWNLRLAWTVWSLNSAAVAFTWIYFLRMIGRDIQSLRRPSMPVDRT